MSFSLLLQSVSSRISLCEVLRCLDCLENVKKDTGEERQLEKKCTEIELRSGVLSLGERLSRGLVADQVTVLYSF